MNTRSCSRDTQVVREVQAALARGWVLVAGRKHKKLRSPTGAVLSIPGTPSDHRASLNFRRDIRRLENTK